MTNRLESGGISCSLLQGEDCAAAVELLTEAFCKNDPIEHALQITPDEFRRMVELDLEPVWRSGLSVVARDADTHELVGALVAMDALSESDTSAKISRKFAPISEVARMLHDRYLAARTIRPGSCLYIFMLGVTPDATGRGIGKLLISEALRNARSRGFGSAFAMTTNLASTHAFKAHGFDTFCTVSYQTYRYKTRLVFASITEHPGVFLMERRLGEPAATGDLSVLRC